MFKCMNPSIVNIKQIPLVNPSNFQNMGWLCLEIVSDDEQCFTCFIKSFNNVVSVSEKIFSLQSKSNKRSNASAKYVLELVHYLLQYFLLYVM